MGMKSKHQRALAHRQQHIAAGILSPDTKRIFAMLHDRILVEEILTETTISNTSKDHFHTLHMQAQKQTKLRPMPILHRLSMAVLLVSLSLGFCSSPSQAQELKYEDRIGSNTGFDMCENFRFNRINKLISDGKISQQQGYNIWKRIRSDKEAVKSVLSDAVAAKELSQSQADRLLPIVDVPMTYFDSQHGRFGQPKELGENQFKQGEVTPKSRAAIYTRLLAANEQGKMHDFDVASIMKQLYAGFDQQSEPIEDVAIYRGALNPRIGQSGSQARVLQSAKMQRAQRTGNQQTNRGYGESELKIADPEDWIKALEEPIYSGPQPGEKVLPLTALNLRGGEAGQEFDPIKLAGDKLHLIFFVRESRTFGRFLGQLRKQLQTIETNSSQAWAMSVIVSTDDVNEAEKSFAILDQRYPKNLIVGLSKDGSAGPPTYGLDKNLTATVIVAKNGTVLHNLPYVGNAFYTQPHILGAVADAMKIDHATLRKYIDGTPGDAAKAAYARGMHRQQGGAESHFRTQLAPLVTNRQINRTEAALLLRLFNDPAKLRNELDKLVKAEKITIEQASQLLGEKEKRSTEEPAGR